MDVGSRAAPLGGAARRGRQTRRRLGGRTPLCACGVTSLIEPTSRRAAWRERIAVSRPEPGPLTKTSTFFMPCSCAWRAADSAASWAANGVDLREPLKPTPPDDAHAITAPVVSVIETIVLLNVDLMCAWPIAMFFFSLRRGFRAAAFGAAMSVSLLRGLRDARHDERAGPEGPGRYLRPAFFLPATVRFGPLRVRAFVFVRWPCTGRPRRWRRPWYEPISTLRRMSAATSRRRSPSTL